MYSPIPREHKYITYIVYTAGMLRREKTRMRTALTEAIPAEAPVFRPTLRQ